MIQMPSVRPVPWAATSGGVQAVSAVRPSQPVAGGRQDATDPAVRGRSDAPSGTAATAGSSQVDQAATQRVTGSPNAQPMDLARERELQREQAQQLEEQAARDREAMDRLREVLTNVWEASAAVVEQALGENAEGSLGGDTSPDLGALASMQRARRPVVLTPAQAQPAPQGTGLPQPGQAAADGTGAAGATGANGDASGAVLGYDENGLGNTERPGAGRIISQRV